MNVQSTLGRPLGYTQLASAVAATGLGTIPAGARFALIVAEADVRWRDDATDPTAAIGMPLGAGSALIYSGDFSALKLIQVSATAVINISFYGKAS
jgi:hypothetical protein